MLPLFEDGNSLYSKNTSLENGQIELFHLDGEAYLKKLYRDNGNVRLVSLNSKYTDIEIVEYSELKVIGKVIL